MILVLDTTQFMNQHQ